MKLKKIASLMLAGIMAVSMLAGCKSGTNTDPETPDVTPVNGAAAVVNSELDKNKEKISFTDNNVITGLMQDYFEENHIASSDWTANVSDLSSVNSKYTKLVEAIRDVLGNVPANNNAIANIGSNNTGKQTYVNVYVVNNDFVSKDNALRMVGKYIDGVDLPKDDYRPAIHTVQVEHKAENDYSYTGTISAIEAKSEGGSESVWVIAVSVTQTASKK